MYNERSNLMTIKSLVRVSLLANHSAFLREITAVVPDYTTIAGFIASKTNPGKGNKYQVSPNVVTQPLYITEDLQPRRDFATRTPALSLVSVSKLRLKDERKTILTLFASRMTTPIDHLRCCRGNEAHHTSGEIRNRCMS